MYYERWNNILLTAFLLDSHSSDYNIGQDSRGQEMKTTLETMFTDEGADTFFKEHVITCKPAPLKETEPIDWDRRELELLRQGVGLSGFVRANYDLIVQFLKAMEYREYSYKVHGIRRYLERFNRWTGPQLKAVKDIVMKYECKLEKDTARGSRKKRLSRRDV